MLGFSAVPRAPVLELSVDPCSQGFVLHFPSSLIELHFALQMIFNKTSCPQSCEKATWKFAELSQTLAVALQMCGRKQVLLELFSLL